MGSVVKVMLVLAVLTVAIWVLVPVTEGYHFGCTPGIDHSRWARLGIEYCK